jgi:hypothetical protein
MLILCARKKTTVTNTRSELFTRMELRKLSRWMNGEDQVAQAIPLRQFLRSTSASFSFYAASRSATALLIFATRTDFAMPKNLRILI